MKIFLTYILVFSSLVSSTMDNTKLVYQALAGDSLESLEKALHELSKQKETSLIRAYQGALIAKEAEYQKGVGDKVKSFKKGATMLEAEIEANPEEVEYRFLRLAIQEQSPGILGYKDNMEEDKKIIIDNYLSLKPALKKQIALYAKKSSVISSDDLPTK
ncbi:hypothetical protein N6H18_00965 [Reichenbachiella agarivorans]|uniref:DUF4142 domain-containing protein n=1 Tax=Reichenbachiella agarivorans TaxID=2979464 RepID=A0ABY6CPX2_9BACT|nr:hypothetical protein [Reichenbachiella agarivorans]UXP32547.1 hypothetical protein N6H18_00965 [Reichenbachiella agarivorans]